MGAEARASAYHLPGCPRDLTWEEHKLFRDAFFPEDVDVLIVLPRRANYVNANPWSWHLWQAPNPWGIGGDPVDDARRGAVVMGPSGSAENAG